MALLFGLTGCEARDPMLEAKAFLEQGRFKAAIEILEDVVLQQNDNLEAHYLYGVALTRVGESGLAEWSLRSAMRDPEYREQAGLLVVNNALRGQNPMEAAKILTEMLEDDPDNVEFLLARASAYAKTRINVEDVKADVARVREIDPDNLDTYRPEILGYLSAVMEEEAEAALEALGQAIEEEDADPAIEAWYCTTMALFAMESQKTDLARERFDACLEAHPEDSATVLAVTEFLHEQGETDRAIEVLETSIVGDSGIGDPGYAPRLSQYLLQAGRVEEAEAVLVEAADSDNLQIRLAYTLQLSQLYESQGRIDDALDRFDQAIDVMTEIGTPTSSARFSLADLAIRAGELDRADEIAGEIEHAPFRLMIQARVAQDRDEHERAMALYAEAGRLWPDNEFARYHAARSAEQLGRFDEAIELYRHATRVSVSTTNAMTRIAILVYAAGNPGEAYNVLRTQRSRAPLGDLGELLRMELLVLIDGDGQVPTLLSTLPRTDTLGAAARLAPAFRALRLRGEPGKALMLASRADPRVFAERGGDLALDELLRTVGADAAAVERVASMLDAALTVRPDAAGLLAVQASLLEREGAAPGEVDAVLAAAVASDGEDPLALLGRARSRVETDPDEALALASRAVDGVGLRTDRVVAVARQLDAAGARSQALALSERILERFPFEGSAALMLAEERVAADDHGDRTLDLALRAVRFARSSRSVALMREVRTARGESVAPPPSESAVDAEASPATSAVAPTATTTGVPPSESDGV